MKQVSFYAGSLPSYVNHLAPIWHALPDEYSEGFYARHEATTRAIRLGIPAKRFRKFRQKEVVVVASYEDYRAAKPASIIFVNHGVGQTYIPKDGREPSSSYTGGPNRERTILFIGPSERDAERSRAVYPDIPAIACGVAYLDQFIDHQVPKDGPVAVSFHADVRTVPETRSSWPFFRDAVLDLRDHFNLLGHSHPRYARILAPWYQRHHIAYEPDWWKVLEQASVYVCDNSSTLYEAAALDIPVVTLSPPWYRREVNHGLRFWDAIPGVHCEDPADLQGHIVLALRDLPEHRQARHHAVMEAYGTLIDGKAAQRAADAIMAVCDG